MPLTLRLTWPGEVANDYGVFEDGVKIGRIRLATEMSWKGGETWNWHIQIHKPGAARNGSAPSLEQAKADFRSAWDRLNRER